MYEVSELILYEKNGNCLVLDPATVKFSEMKQSCLLHIFIKIKTERKTAEDWDGVEGAAQREVKR